MNKACILHEFCCFCRNHDSGLNSSHSSSQGPGMTTNPSHNVGRRMFGTNDAIAKLYSSPGGTRRHFNTDRNQSNGLSNENSPYNRLNVRPSNQTRPYNSQTNTPNRTQMNSSQLSGNHNSYDRNGGHYSDTRSQGVSSSNYDNQYNTLQSQDHKHNDSRSRNLQNGYIDHSRPKVGAPSDYLANNMSQSRSGLRTGTGYPESNNQQKGVQNSINYDSFGYATVSHNRGQSGQPQRVGTSPQKPDMYGFPQYGQPTGNLQAENQNASPWQYVGNGRTKSTGLSGPRSDVKAPVQQVNIELIFLLFYTD